jgi:hypothetical protein
MQSNQTSSQQICFFAAQAFPANQVNHGLRSFALLRSRNATTSAKSPMPFATTPGHQFYLLSPEAFLLTLCGKGKLLVSEKIKKEAWGSQDARPGVWPCEVAAIVLT